MHRAIPRNEFLLILDLAIDGGFEQTRAGLSAG
jgi:hypothetical protein